MNELIAKYLKKIRQPKALMILGLTGIVLIFVSTLIPTEKTQKKTNNGEFSAESYCAELEKDIYDIVRSITGSRNATVVVTLESGIRYSYADVREGITSDRTESESQSSESEFKEGYITVKNADGGEQALLITAQMPEIRGVAIVCEGGDSELIAEKIKSTVTAALNITSKRVYICGRKQ